MLSTIVEFMHQVKSEPVRAVDKRIGVLGLSST